jgi:uncharacterized protein (DUF1778 family)
MREKIRHASRLEVRLPSEVLERFKRAAQVQGRSLTDFVVAAADEAACREDRMLIAEAIINPPKPTPALRKAARRYRELFGVE